MARRLDDVPGADVGFDDDALHEVAVGRDEPLDPVAASASQLRPLRQGRHRHPAHPRDLQATRQRLVGILGCRRHVGVVGVHPQLAAADVDHVGRLAIVVGVRVRADEQAHVLQAQADL
jgi:hypothetical protein